MIASRWFVRGAMCALVSMLGVSPAVSGEPRIAEYHTGSFQIPQTPSVSGGAVGALGNPASWATSARGETALWWSDRSVRTDEVDHWGFSTGKTLGFSGQRSVLGTSAHSEALWDFQSGLAFGDRRSHFGIAYKWSTGGGRYSARENAIATGWISRPIPQLSYGLSGTFSIDSDAALGIADIGIRPFSKPWVTLFADYSLRDSEAIDDGRWGAGAEIRPWRGIHVGAKVRDGAGTDDDFGYSLNLGLTFEGFGFHLLPSFNQDGERRPEEGGLLPTTYLVRLDPPYRGLPVNRTVRKLKNDNDYVKVNLEDKRITYTKARLFDDDRIAWIDLIRKLDAIRDDETVHGVAINLAGSSRSAAVLWELRQKLEELRSAGKEVIVHIEGGSFFSYYLASAADVISLDPHTELLLPGIAIKRTYMKGALEKLGIGFEEWRYFKYKSAMESLSRNSMSDTDREQYGRLLDVFYESVKTAVCESRGISSSDFEEIVNHQPFLDADDALQRDMVDRVGRWDTVGEWLGEHRDGELVSLPADRDRQPHPDERWGKPPVIDVVYAIGECDLYKGIRGRATSKHLREIAEDDDVVGVVLRADSPGGLRLPSDLVASAMTKIRESGRPAMVSQGSVAASGGYWISAPGEKIFTTPMTITGSIGVIGGWAWDEGLGDKIGFSADGVQRGTHSDLFTGIRLPVGRITIPTRNLDSSEKELVRKGIRAAYDEFVEYVAGERDLPVEKVREIAEGRVWMGPDALDLGLCDEIGGLSDAIDAVKEQVGIEPGDEVVIREFPKRKLFQFPGFGPSIPGAGVLAMKVASLLSGGAEDNLDLSGGSKELTYDEFYLKSIIEEEGRPLLLTPPDDLPADWLEPMSE